MRILLTSTAAINCGASLGPHRGSATLQFCLRVSAMVSALSASLFIAAAALPNGDPPTSTRALASNVEMSQPSWSPSSLYIAYDSLDPAGIFVVSPDSGKVDEIAGSPTFNHPAWSPVGGTLLVTDFGASRRLILIDVSNTDATKTLPVESTASLEAWSWSWSPDATRILYRSDDGLAIFNLANGRTRGIPAPASESAITARWTDREGELLVQRGLELYRENIEAAPGAVVRFGSARLFEAAPNGNVWIVPTTTSRSDTADQQMLEIGRAGKRVAAWDFSGKVASFDVSPVSGFVAVAIAGVGIEIVDPGTGRRTYLTRGTLDSVPSWSPDEKMIAFLRQRSMRGPADLYVAAVDADGE